jgi:hypothetical protein
LGQPTGAEPHHVVLVADPQLVDPHTYPDRPWPLSTLTVRYTDLYLARSYGLLQKKLYPDTTLFLGDLFDGGREWGAAHGSGPEERWNKYGQGFWHKEYRRFSRIFFNTWVQAGVAGRSGQPGRRQIHASLPGNHDLGFAAGVQKAVRSRFSAYFGESNRIDLIGNHTFVSLDTVSLSAKGVEGGEEDIWRPTSRFLETFENTLGRATSDYSRVQRGLHAGGLYPHRILEGNDLKAATLLSSQFFSRGQFPSILLTHVPLFREPGTPCGPLREHWPPSFDGNGQPLEVDHRNAIAVARGYQYQNVLSLDISKEITTAIGNLSYAFSGDDHDYCEVLHRRYPSAGGGIRETTVKSVSWAMGVRKPGFQMLSLWNPVNEGDSAIKSGDPKGTLQSHQCLLPDQLSIFIRYAILIVMTLALLTLRAGHLALNPSKSSFSSEDRAPLLPTSRSPPPRETEKAESSSSDDGVHSHHSLGAGLSSRLATTRTRSSSPRPSAGYGLPAATATEYTTPIIAHANHHERKPVMQLTKALKTRRLTCFGLFRAELAWSLVRVASVVLLYYGWMIRNG